MNRYLGHRHDRGRELVCNAAMIPLAEARADSRHAQLPKATYVDFPGGFVGAFSSPAGPVLFVNGDQHRFTDPSWSVRVEKRGDVHRAIFTGLIGGPLVIDYRAWRADPADAWADETLDDFYQWLAAKRASASLIHLWTDRAA